MFFAEMVNFVGDGKIKENQLEKPSKFYIDNKGAIELTRTKNEVKRSKHIDIRHRYIKELAAGEVIDVEYVDTKNNMADIFTKGLGPKPFHYLLEKLGCYAGMKAKAVKSKP
jgi:hypothetical protein